MFDVRSPVISSLGASWNNRDEEGPRSRVEYRGRAGGGVGSRAEGVGSHVDAMVSPAMASAGLAVFEQALAKDESYPDLWDVINANGGSGYGVGRAGDASLSRSTGAGVGSFFPGLGRSAGAATSPLQSLGSMSAGTSASASFSADYVDDAADPGRVDRLRGSLAPLPRVLMDQYNRGEQSVFMGLLPEIRRVWVAIDSRLYLWHYDVDELDGGGTAPGAGAGAGGHDFCVYDGLDQAIVAVGLAPVRAGVFVASVQYVLAVATAVECVLLAVTLGPGDDLTLHPTGLAAPSDGILFNAVVGSHSGRLFLAARDGSLYEVTYDDESWSAAARRLSARLGVGPGGTGATASVAAAPADRSDASSGGGALVRCRKRNRSQSQLAFLVPAFVRHWFGGRAPLVALAVDETRNILFALSAASDVEVFDLGADGQQIWLAGRSTGAEIAASARALCPRLTGGGRDLRVVAIHPVPLHESAPIGLVAVTSSGARLYFATTRCSSWEVPRRGEPRRPPSKLQLKHVRLPPPMRGVASGAAGVPDANVVQDAAYYGQGLFVMACAVSDGEDALVVCRDELLLLDNDDGGVMGDATVPAPVQGAAVGGGMAGDGYGAHGAPAAGSGASSSRRSGLEGFDPSSFHRIPFRERRLAVPLGARVFAVAEQPVPVLVDPRLPAARDLPPWAFGDGATGISARSAVGVRNVLATQHLVPPRRVLCLTGAGLHVLSQPRPIDQLERLLLGGARGGAADPLAQFFGRYGAAESCAMCLMLCSSRRVQSEAAAAAYRLTASSSQGAPHDQLALAAAQAFFQLGGRPSLERVSGDAAVASMAAPALRRSGMHDGLALHMARLLRPVWAHSLLLAADQLVVEGRDGGGTTGGGGPGARRLRRRYQRYELRLTADALVGVVQSLRALRQFFEAHPNFAPAPHAPTMEMDARKAAAELGSLSTPGMPMTHRLMRFQRRRLDDEALRLEARSLMGLRALLTRALETSSFLALLADQDFDRLARGLPASVQTELDAMTFSELTCTASGERVVRALVDSLIARDAANEVLVEAVSSRLRERCPSLFTEPDRVRFQGAELLAAAREAGTGDDEVRRELLAKACERFCSVASRRIDVDAVCGQFVYLRGYAAAVSVALAFARAVDPLNEALRAHLSSPSPGDSAAAARSGGGAGDGAAAALHALRMRAYRWPVAALAELRDIARRGELAAADNGIARRDETGQLVGGGDADERPHLSSADAALVYRAVKQQCFESDDQLFHLILYDWFLSAGGQTGPAPADGDDGDGGSGAPAAPSPFERVAGDGALQDELLAAQTPYLEAYLRSTSADLLYKYYIRSGEFEKAATTLFGLAVQAGPRLNLAARLQHLARAKGCLGQAVSGSARALLLDVQERLDVGRIQARVADDLSELPPQHAAADSACPWPTAGDAVVALERQLFDLSPLFTQFAEPFELYWAQLAIVHCASHDDSALVQRILRLLMPAHEPVSALAAIVVQLGQEYYPSETVFPLAFLVDWLERIGALARARGELNDPAWLIHALLRVGVPWTSLFDHYAGLLWQFTRNPSFSGSLLYRVHLHVVLLMLLSEWVHHELGASAAQAPAARRDRLARHLQARGVADLLDQMVLCLAGLSERELEAEGGEPRDLFVATNDAKILKEMLFGSPVN